MQQAIAPELLTGWSTWDAMGERGARIAVRMLLSRLERGLLPAFLALNRQYIAHRVSKWQRRLISNLRIAPDGLGRRFDDLGQAADGAAICSVQLLLEDVLKLQLDTTIPT